MNSEVIIGLIIIVANVAGLFFMLIMSIYTIKNKGWRQYNKAESSQKKNKNHMQTNFSAGDLNLDDEKDIFEDMDLMDFDELNLEDFD